MGKTVSASAISEFLSDERASKKKKTIKLSAPKYKYNDDLESGALDIAKGVGQAASLVMLPSGIASITRGVGKVTGKRNETAEKVTSALAMPSAKMWQGFMSGAEGIYDFVIGGGTQIAGAVSKNKDIKDAAKWIYSNSWSSELSGAKDIDETLQNDSKAYKVTGDILSGIGNVAFQMGLAMLTMGAANAATAAGSAGALAGNSGMSVGLAKGITYGSLFASAAGSGTAESMSKTGDLGWRENLSGVLKGGVEVATELISPTGQLIGTKFLENAAAKGSAEAAKKLAAKTMGESIKVSTKRALAKKLVSNFAGEATEEMLSYAGGWLIENKLNISDEKFSVQEMLYQGLMGGIAGSIFSSPADVHMFRVNKSTGAAVYAKGDAYAQGKINEGLTLVKLYKEKGVKGGAIDLAEAALTKLATDETLSQTQKEYYMGLAENVVLKTDLSETAKQYATALAERAAADPSYAESVANSLNAIVNEAGGKGEYTAADIANKDSGAARIVTLSQMLSDFVNPSADERIIHSFIDAANNATDWNNSAEQLDAVRNLQVGEDQQLVYKVDYVKDGNVYAVVKKRVDPKTGKESYSLAYTTTGQITSENPQLYPMHDLSYDEVTSFLEGGLYFEQEVDQMIAEEQDRRETEAEQRREREQARNAEQKPNRKKKKKNAQTEQAGEQTQANRATQEDLSAFERSMMPKLGIDNSDFTQDEWITARECIPNIDNLTRREKARILTLVRTANATGQNAEYVKGLARLSAAFGFGVVFYPDTKASGFYMRGNDMVFINPGNLDVTYGHEIQHSYDQEQKNGVAVYRTDLIEAVKKIVGEKVFEKAKAQYKADYEAFRKETGIRPISDAELEGEASANVVGKYLSNMTILKKIAATDYSLGRGLLAAIRRMKDKWTSAKAFAKENDSTAFAEYRKMTRIEKMLVEELKKAKAKTATAQRTAAGISYYPSEVHLLSGESKSTIDAYIDKAQKKQNEADYKKYASVSKRLSSDLSDDIDIRGYTHALRDNDIRHILNSHGENTTEKYPVTIEDIKLIPYIVEKYDIVFYNDYKGKDSIVYVKVSVDGTIYYVEQVTDQYGNEKLLVNKQMIKTGEDDIPSTYRESIKKKMGETEFRAELKKFREEYAQDVYRSHPNNNVSQSPAVVNPSGENISYSPAGDTSSAAFKRWFGNSPFKNEDGTPKVYYHGAKKGGGFTVFRDWQYFTDKKQYAERYAERDNPNALYEVYLTADKVFDTRNADAHKIFQSIRDEYGLSELQDTGLPDWTDGYDITEYLSEHPELGYDAVILDEGGDLVDGEPVSRGESIIIKDSAQVKSATDNIGTYDRANPDIRYSPVTPETDSRYLSLARDPQKNESELRRLVKEAAKAWGAYQENGTPKVLYHGTDADFTVFSKDKTGIGYWFTADKDYATGFGDKTIGVYLNLGRSLDLDTNEGENNFIKIKDALFGRNADEKKVYSQEMQRALLKNGYNSFQFEHSGEKTYIVFNSNQVKSADPVTYDDDGNVIPLSERFNPQNNDIRYSPAETQRRVVTRAQMPKPGVSEKITNAKGLFSRQGFRNALKDGGSAWESFKIVTVNAQQALENQLVRGGMTKRQAAAWSQLARTGRLHANNAIGYALADMTGEVRSEGLMKIISPFLATKGEVYKVWDENIQDWVNVTAKGGELAGKRYDDFSEYLAMLNAIDRAKVGKNPYGDMTVAQMKRTVEKYEKENPDFKAASEQFSQYNNVMLDILVQSGMVSQELADEFRKKYPHYIPMRTADSTPVGSGAIRGAENLEVRRGLRTAAESNHRVDDPIKNYITQVESRIKAAKLNMLAIEIYETADGFNVVRGKDSQATAKELRTMEKQFLEDPLSMPDPTELFRKFQTGDNTRNEITFYKDGKMLTMAVSDRIYTGFTDLAGQHSAILDSGLAKLSKKINDTFKKLVTNWNPFFSVRNIARDLQDGLLQTRHGFFEFQKMYLKNADMMRSGKFNDLWVEFVANGGLESSLFSDEFATYTIGGKSGLEQAHGVVGQFQHIKNFNTLTEALPRFTEYCLTRMHGGSVQTALLNAADVTVNFGRGGTLTKILNSTVSPFLNPAVQGLDRVVRLFTEEGLRNNKALASLLVKAVLLGILPMALSNWMYGDEEEYEDMEDDKKENNYLFKLGNTWLKLPRGRVVSTIAGLYNRSVKELMGKDVDWKDYGKNVLDQITPAQNVARHIGSPFFDVANNRTWYGSAIESQSLQNYAVKDRYDENTSRISVWLGKFTSHFGLSPKEVNYLIDQYTGVIGDILLPTTTPAGTKGVVSYNFTVDQNTSSNLSSRFYDLYDKTMYKANGGDAEAYYLKKRLDETKSAASELFKEIKAINADSSLSNKEKVKQAGAVRAMVNQLYKTALQDAKGYAENVKDAIAIEKNYSVEQITQQNAKQYGLTKSDLGKYAVMLGGQVVKLYGSEGEATEYKNDTSKKTVYAEANRLTYGSEYALKEYNANVYDKASTLNELGVSWDEYYNYYMTVRYYSGADKKKKILAYLNGSGLSNSQIALLLYYSGYSGYTDEAKKAIKASSLSAERKKELLMTFAD